MSRKVTLLMIIGISYNFIRRLLFTINPDLNISPAANYLSMFLTILASIFIIVYFLNLSRSKFASGENLFLNSIIAVITTTLAILISELSIKLGMLTIENFQIEENMHYLDVLVKWLNAISLSILFFSLYSILSRDKREKSAIYAGLTFLGCISLLIIRSSAFLNYYYYSIHNSTLGMEGKSINNIIGLFLLFFYFITFMLFLVHSYKKDIFDNSQK